MREILFRGKSIYTCKWAESVCPHGVMRSGHLSDDFIPETVGQYTGLTDKNGKQIFEGDIVEPVLVDGTHKGFSWGRQVVVFDRGAFGLKSRREEITPMCNYAANVQFIVWGNIHDNPELLEVQ